MNSSYAQIMSEIVPVDLLSGKEKFSQKCIVPFHLFEKTDLKLGEYVLLKTSDDAYICRIYSTLLSVPYILIDDVCRLNSYKRMETLNFPDELSRIKISYFERITVKLLINEDSTLNCYKATYEGVIRSILSQYVTGRNFVIKCSGLKLADFFHIHSIIITETFPNDHIYGRLNERTVVEVMDVTSREQVRLRDDFQNLRLGGIDNVLSLLRLNFNQPSRVTLVSGPSGSGKSSLVKIFCGSIDSYLIAIDGLKNADLTTDKCCVYCKQFSSYSKMFPDKMCILFIDHVDAMAPYNSKQKLPSISVLISLIKYAKELGAYIIMTAVHKSNIISEVACLFDSEVNLGVPSFQQRKEIVDSLSQSLSCQVDSQKVARLTPGFVGNDIALLIKETISNTSKTGSNEESDVRCLTLEDIENALVSVSPSVLKASLWNMKVKPVYWKDIGGMFQVKKRLQMCVERPLQNPDVFKKVDLPCPRGVLLYGPPGCCKTTLARSLATECNANFFAANPAQIYSAFVGESEKNITELFYQARLCAPSIIFLDELDSLVSQRKLDQKNVGIGEKVLSTLLNEMDGFGTKVRFQNNINIQKLINEDESTESKNDGVGKENYSNNDVIVVAATNRPDLIDDALLRPGRFDVILYVPPPNLDERESILQTLTEDMPMKDIDLKKSAENTDLLSGADLKYLCNEAKMTALRHDATALYITEENFNEALCKVKPSITSEQIQMYETLFNKYGSVIKRF